MYTFIFSFLTTNFYISGRVESGGKEHRQTRGAALQVQTLPTLESSSYDKHTVNLGCDSPAVCDGTRACFVSFNGFWVHKPFCMSSNFQVAFFFLLIQRIWRIVCVMLLSTQRDWKVKKANLLLEPKNYFTLEPVQYGFWYCQLSQELRDSFELDVRKLFVVSTLQRSEELRLYNLV
jgi:hypothetical protein